MGDSCQLKGTELRNLEESLLNRPSILPFVNIYERGMKM